LTEAFLRRNFVHTQVHTGVLVFRTPRVAANESGCVPPFFKGCNRMTATRVFSPSKIEKRWTARLALPFCGVSSYFLANYHRLAAAPGQPGLNSTEAVLIIQLHDFKWDDRHPFPTVGTLAVRLGVTPRHVRDTMKALQERGYLLRIPGARGPDGC
jgi:hypothetical protein